MAWCCSTSTFSGISLDYVRQAEALSLVHIQDEQGLPELHNDYTPLSRTQLKVQVRSLTGQTWSLPVHGDANVAHIKALLRCKTGLHPCQQLLLHSGQGLDSNKRISDYSIADGSEIHLVPKLQGGGQLFIRTITGKTVTINIEMTDTVANLKRKIYEKEGIPVELQKLVFGKYELRNEQMLASAGIHNESIVNVLLVVKDFLHIFVRTITGKELTIDIEMTDTVANLKRKIHEKEGMSVGQQKLIFGGNELKNEQTLASAGIIHESTVNVVLVLKSLLHIFVQTITGKQLAIDIEMGDTVANLKKKIHEKGGMPVAQQKLMFGGKELKNEQTLASAKIGDEAKVQETFLLKGGPPIFIRTITGKQFQIEIEMTDTVATLKNQIEEKQGTPVAQQKLMFGGNELYDEQTLASAGITIQSTVDLLFNLSHVSSIFIKTFTGNTIMLSCSATATIASVKKTIRAQMNIPTTRQRLIFGGRCLSDEEILKSAGIIHESMLRLVLTP